DIKLPSGGYEDTLNLTIASGDLPDIMSVSDRFTADKYGQQGAFMNVLPYVEEMPNLRKFLDNNPEIKKQFLSSDGKMYMFPHYGFGDDNRKSWMYRKDIFDKNAIKPPGTWEEMYQAAKKLKQLYPDSYPFVFRNGINALADMAPSFGTNLDFYYDDNSKEWKYGPLDDGFKELITMLSMFYKEGLIVPDWLSTNTQQWVNLVSQNKGFITVDYIGRIDFYNSGVRKDNPSFAMNFMAPPAGSKGIQKNIFSGYMGSGFAIAATSKKTKDLIRYFDYMYSDEAKEMMSWGKEGVTYTVVGGKKQWKPEYTNVTKLYADTGLYTIGAYAMIDYAGAILTGAPAELQDAHKQIAKYDDKLIIIPPLNESENDSIATALEGIGKSRDEYIAKVILGEKSIGDWAKFADEVKQKGLQKVLDVYKKAYERMK
ncbi:MAG: transporter substrate-binding protein, partial [Paenibacillus sp.]|nr:transporter substrate-binding protein [Paenibacillus sp.]